MTFFRVGCVLLVLFLTPLFVFPIYDAYALFENPSSITFEQRKRIYVPASSGATDVLTIPPISIGTQTDRLLVASIALDNQGSNGDISVSYVQFQGGVGCGVAANSQNFTSAAIANNAGNARSEIWYLVNPPENETCNVIIKLDNQIGNTVPGASAVARAVFFSGVHQGVSIDGQFSNTGGPSTIPTVNKVPNPTNSSQIIIDTVSTTIDEEPVTTILGQNQIRINKQTFSGVNPFNSDWSSAYSYQNGTSADVAMSYSTTSNSNWAISGIVINSCDIGSSCTVVSSSSSSSSSGDENGSCRGDCSPPTLGIDKNNKRVVSNGFAFNKNPVDAELYYTPYPLITAYVGEENAIDLRIYENDGPSNLAHVAVAFGLGNGETFGQSNAMINWDRSFDGKETVSLIDPYNVLANVTVNVTEVDCDDIGSKCNHVTVYHTFRAPLEFNMVATNIWDHDRNAWQNYFNHGLQVVGESLNPPNIHSGIYKGKIYQLTEVEKNKSVDDDGNTWTFDYGIWNKDYVDTKKADRQLVNPEKIWAINHVLKEYSIGDSSDASTHDRYHDQFSIQKEYQIILAESLLEEICPKCFDDEFEEIDNISYYDFDVSIKRTDDPEFANSMKLESEKAEFLLEEMINSFYPGRVFEEE
ncbi:hypothetical protein C5F49_06635 [Nitrosopumilus oxyclinae]|uniref:Uncharacterized protein n=1 Tax=Nitrosopumilus oxyclinae TaxID=1959104 RepID=A0A7D5M1W4_9ARCH|nr:hypothetical protein [Nitrosopumilus oxyclinae]QLH05026.1 hypothetical protein C5F49_06635 [Nitrosopumilus oxyclinae]